jgi:hypothetical protein
MSENPSRRKKPSTKALSSTEKGRIVERIVALMHMYPDTDVKVEQNVYLPPVLRKNGRKRQIDVLLTRDVAGHPIQIAIECKNEARPIDTPAIESFAKKLQRVGIPYGIYVSASGFTKDAIADAALDGIKTFTLKDLTEAVLYTSVTEAFHSIVYLFCQIVVVCIRTQSGEYRFSQVPFYDQDGKQCGTLGDLVWQKWISQDPPLSLGGHEILLELPAHWNFVLDDTIIPVTSIIAWINVSGLFGGRIGEAVGNVYSLVNAVDDSINRNLFDINIDVSESDYIQAWVHKEDELQKLLKRSERVSLHQRIKLPRIVTGGRYWPPTAGGQKRINELMQSFTAGEIADLQPFNFEEIEGCDINTAFEPPDDDYYFPFEKEK